MTLSDSDMALWYVSPYSPVASIFTLYATDDHAHPEDAESEEAFAERMLGTKESVVEEAPPEPEEEDDD